MIFRVNKTEDYFAISNYHLKDPALSLKAKGLLSLIFSLPEDFDYTVSNLSKLSMDKETSTISALDDLKFNGYLQIRKIMPNTSSTGRIEYEYDIYEKPQEPIKQDLEKQDLEILPLVLEEKTPCTGKRRDKKEYIYKYIYEKEAEVKSKFTRPSLEEVKAYCEERSNGIDPQYFIDYYDSLDWYRGKTKIKDWKGCVRTWERKAKEKEEAKNAESVEEFKKEGNVVQLL